MKGVFENRPDLPKNNIVRDTNTVLDYLKKVWTVARMSLKTFHSKLPHCMGLLSPQRLQTILILSLEKYVCNFRTLQAQNRLSLLNTPNKKTSGRVSLLLTALQHCFHYCWIYQEHSGTQGKSNCPANQHYQTKWWANLLLHDGLRPPNKMQVLIYPHHNAPELIARVVQWPSCTFPRKIYNKPSISVVNLAYAYFMGLQIHFDKKIFLLLENIDSVIFTEAKVFSFNRLYCLEVAFSINKLAIHSYSYVPVTLSLIANTFNISRDPLVSTDEIELQSDFNFRQVSLKTNTACSTVT